MRTRTLRIGVASMFVAGVLALAGAAALAEVDGPCTATLAGVDVATRSSSNAKQAIVVGENDQIQATMAAQAGLSSHRIQLEFAGFRWTVSEDTDNGAAQAVESVNVADYARYGAGLYKVVGSADLVNGQSCTGAVLVRVGLLEDREPFTGPGAVEVHGVDVHSGDGVGDHPAGEAQVPAPGQSRLRVDEVAAELAGGQLAGLVELDQRS